MLFERIKADLTTSMKAGTALRTSVVRMLLSELNYKQIDVQRELTDDDVLGVVQKEVKKRREAIEAYTKGGRSEQAETEREELLILQEYLPAQLSDDEIRKQVTETVAQLESKEFGAVMKVISPLFRGKADGAVVARLVKETLGL